MNDALTRLRASQWRLAVDGLVLRALDPEDASLLVESVNESLDHLRPWMQWAQVPARLDDTAVRLALGREAMEAGADGSWAMVRPTTSGDRIVGGCGLHDRVGPGARDIGYWVHAAWLGQGLATRAAAALTWVAFECLDLERVEILCDVENERSAAVPRRLGFRHVRTYENDPGAPANSGRMMAWELNRREWPASPASEYPVEVLPDTLPGQK